ncbi:MAG: IS91 family transposase [Acidobacteria bacterium]|nr:MAG: IS91 family transposase [Acidobacteriota bacterium]
MQYSSFEYIPRKPEETILYRVVSEQLATFLARQEDRQRPMPKFVEREFRSFLECGIPAYGFVRVHCDSCGHDRVVAFSCKGRVWCPGCGGRRMADTAAHLVDRVFPIVPVRQWVLSMPFALRYKMAYDSRLMGGVLNVFARAVLGHLRRRARKLIGLRDSQSGAVTFIQRFGDALNCNVHFHTLALDGVYTHTENQTPEFHELPAPEDDEIVEFTTVVGTRIRSLLNCSGLGAGQQSEDEDSLSRDDPGMAALYASSIRGKIAVGSNMGYRVARLGDQIDGDTLDVLQSPRCATVNGFSVHANVSIPAYDRMRLERLCRYAARPAVATERLSELPDGRLLYRLKRPWRNGTSAVIFEPQDLLAKLAALVPAPRVHLVRFHGILGPAAAWRPLIIPTAAASTESAAAKGNSIVLPESVDAATAECAEQKSAVQRCRNYSWAQLMKRVFAIDVLQCDRCGGVMRIIATIHPPDTTRKILDCLGLPSRAPPLTPALRERAFLFDQF